MASSPDADPDEGAVRWPLVAKIGVGLAVLTVVVGVAAALVAAFVVDRDDDPPVVVEEGVAEDFSGHRVTEP